MKRNRIASFFGLLLVSAVACGESGESDEDLPDAEFLEFLADWETQDGEWQDPMQYDDAQWQVLEQKAGQDDE